MPFDELRRMELFTGVSDDQLRDLVSCGEELLVQPGEQLFRAGRPAEFWWVLLDGTIELVRHVGAEDAVLGAMSTPGQWAGGFRAWDDHGVYMATGRVVAPTRVLRVPADALGARADEWFPFGVHLIKGLVGTVRTIESTARQREALASLGTLAAGLAHEINNPASAATRAVSALRDTCDQLLLSLRSLAEAGITAEQFVELDVVRRGLRPPPADDGPLAVSDREEALTEWLDDHGVPEAWTFADALAAAGVDPPCCERLLSVMGERALGPALRWVAASEATGTLLGEVDESTQRISALVAAVRSYSQLDRAAVQRMDVTEGLESTLAVLAHKLKPGITVVREYAADVPAIEGIPGELNQVWTNLIDNAVDAMSGTGTLRLSTTATDESVVVEVADTGPGIPADVRPHVFEPFFTTKDVGKGTGLGLDISRRIVVGRHGGEITVGSADDGSVFRVTLPRRGTQT
jgi:signal transduction histidine kinase